MQYREVSIEDNEHTKQVFAISLVKMLRSILQKIIVMLS
jgi:hypothetical protein